MRALKVVTKFKLTVFPLDVANHLFVHVRRTELVVFHIDRLAVDHMDHVVIVDTVNLDNRPVLEEWHFSHRQEDHWHLGWLIVALHPEFLVYPTANERIY